MRIFIALGHRECHAKLCPHSLGIYSEDEACGLPLRKRIPGQGVGGWGGTLQEDQKKGGNFRK